MGKEDHTGSLQTPLFDCGDGQAVRVDRVCDFVPDCGNSADERSCGQFGYADGMCTWNIVEKTRDEQMVWCRKPIGLAPHSPATGADERRGGHYLLLNTDGAALGQQYAFTINSFPIRNTDQLCTLVFWYNYVFKGDKIDVYLHMKTAGFDIQVWSMKAVSREPSENVWNEAIVILGRLPANAHVYFSVALVGQTLTSFAVDLMEYKLCALPARHCNCSDSEFRCRNGACVGKERRCNFVDDCGDNSDERQCVLE
ncbi:apical endosomal glycoprotein-like [Amblyomma americanum]